MKRILRCIFTLVISFVAYNIALPQVTETILRYSQLPSQDYDEAIAVCLDQSLNIYVTGNSYSGSTQKNNITTLKYNKDGTLLWTRYFNGIANKNDECNAIIVDSDGNVYVAGRTMASNDRYDFLVIKYNTNGDFQWSHIYNGTNNNNDEAKSIAIEQNGSIVVTGYTNDWDFCTEKISTTGSLIWRRIYTSGDDIAKIVRIDNDNNIIVTGKSTIWNADYCTIKYNQNGDSLWVKKYDAGQNGGDEPYGLVIDAYNNIYVGGKSNYSNQYTNFCLIKYNSGGQQLFVKTYNGPANLNDDIYAITKDTANNIIVTGTSEGSGTGTDIYTIKYSPLGAVLWSARHNGSADQIDKAYAVGVDYRGDVYVAGQIQVGWSYSVIDFCTIKYNGQTGSPIWVKTYNGPGNGPDVINSMATDFYGNIVVTGKSTGLSTGDDFCTIQYLQPPFGPTNLRATAISNNDIYVECDMNSNNHSTFRFEYSSDGGVSWPWVSVSQNPYDTISNLQSNTIYHVRAFAHNVAGGSEYSNIAYDTTFNISNIEPVKQTPFSFSLSQNFPNPFNPTTNIKFDVAKLGNVKIVVFDVMGREVQTLVNESLKPGSYKTSFDGSILNSGVYFYKISAGDFSETKRMLLIK